ncbi:MipA/OmpV family protein [Candidatus Symbiopectobacterium sp.]|nr:MipA/OmpV family protein [Candidatus Symbiopectobacterium sp.]
MLHQLIEYTTRLSDEVKESTMVDRSYTMVFGAGVSYRF